MIKRPKKWHFSEDKLKGRALQFLDTQRIKHISWNNTLSWLCDHSWSRIVLDADSDKWSMTDKPIWQDDQETFPLKWIARCMTYCQERALRWKRENTPGRRQTEGRETQGGFWTQGEARFIINADSWTDHAFEGWVPTKGIGVLLNFDGGSIENYLKSFWTRSLFNGVCNWDDKSTDACSDWNWIEFAMAVKGMEPLFPIIANGEQGVLRWSIFILPVTLVSALQLVRHAF
jgi:hypothetical protein